MLSILKGKLASVVVILAVVLLPSVTGARVLPAGFSDSESSAGNTISTGTLDFSLESSGDFLPSLIVPAQTARETIKLKNKGSLNFQYRLETENLLGDTSFCEKLNLKAKVGGVEKYNGNLDELLISGNGPADSNDWEFNVSFDDRTSDLKEKKCRFDFVFEGWQDNLDYGEGGFTDTEKISGEIKSGNWSNHLLISEVYYDVDGSHGSEPDNEWVEIYNSTGSAVDISGWKICDGNSCDIIPSASPVGNGGTAVLTDKSSTWGYWSLPTEAIKIAINSPLGSGLNNGAETVILKNSQNEEIDALSYGGDNVAFSPDCLGVSEGHSLARNPTGKDTDSKNDFINLTNPSPGKVNE